MAEGVLSCPLHTGERTSLKGFVMGTGDLSGHEVMGKIPGYVSPSCVYSGMFKFCSGPKQLQRSNYPILWQ